MGNTPVSRAVDEQVERFALSVPKGNPESKIRVRT
jgi:hypothetical protein